MLVVICQVHVEVGTIKFNKNSHTYFNKMPFGLLFPHIKDNLQQNRRSPKHKVGNNEQVGQPKRTSSPSPLKSGVSSSRFEKMQQIALEQIRLSE